MKNQRVNVTPGAPKGHEVYGTLKTVLGVPVIEVHAGYYESPDLRFSLYRRANEHAETYARGNWMIEDAADSRSFSDPIPTKRVPSYTASYREPIVTCAEVRAVPSGFTRLTLPKPFAFTTMAPLLVFAALKQISRPVV